MKKKILICDKHLLGPNPIGKPFRYEKNVVDLGDNFELKNVPHGNKLNNAIIVYMEHKVKCRKMGIPQVKNNHAVKYSGELPEFVVDEGVVYTHGHRIFYSIRKWFKWEMGDGGQGKIMIFFSGLLSRGRHIYPMRKFSKRQTKKIKKYIKYLREVHGLEFHTLAFGHTHPNILIDCVIDGIRVVNPPQGETEICL